MLLTTRTSRRAAQHQQELQQKQQQQQEEEERRPQQRSQRKTSPAISVQGSTRSCEPEGQDYFETRHLEKQVHWMTEYELISQVVDPPSFESYYEDGFMEDLLLLAVYLEGNRKRKPRVVRKLF